MTVFCTRYTSRITANIGTRSDLNKRFTSYGLIWEEVPTLRGSVADPNRTLAGVFGPTGRGSGSSTEGQPRRGTGCRDVRDRSARGSGDQGTNRWVVDGERRAVTNA